MPAPNKLTQLLAFPTFHPQNGNVQIFLDIWNKMPKILSVFSLSNMNYVMQNISKITGRKNYIICWLLFHNNNFAHTMQCGVLLWLFNLDFEPREVVWRRYRSQQKVPPYQISYQQWNLAKNFFVGPKIILRKKIKLLMHQNRK